LQDALAALLPNDLALSAKEVRKIRQKEIALTLIPVSILGAVIYLWVHGFFG
jgi:virulence-associated protein VagC